MGLHRGDLAQIQAISQRVDVVEKHRDGSPQPFLRLEFFIKMGKF
jgi:hypothetical protein